MQNMKHFVFAASVSILLGATTWAQVPKSSGMNGDSTRYQSQVGSRQDSMSNDSVTRWRGLTASDQSNDSTDLEITRKIRKEIIAKKGMSVNARNVKIVTIDGKITLKGDVNSASEKEIIGQMANEVTDSENVTNELQIK